MAARRDLLPSCLFAGRLCCRRKRARARASIDVAAMFAGEPSLQTCIVSEDSAHSLCAACLYARLLLPLVPVFRLAMVTGCT